MNKMLDFVIIANPETRRLQVFQQALERFGLRPARLISYADLLANRCELAQFDSPDTIFRFNAPERSLEVDREFIVLSKEKEYTKRHQRMLFLAIFATSGLLLLAFGFTFTSTLLDFII